MGGSMKFDEDEPMLHEPMLHAYSPPAGTFAYALIERQRRSAYPNSLVFGLVVGFLGAVGMVWLAYWAGVMG